MIVFFFYWLIFLAKQDHFFLVMQLLSLCVCRFNAHCDGSIEFHSIGVQCPRPHTLGWGKTLVSLRAIRLSRIWVISFTSLFFILVLFKIFNQCETPQVVCLNCSDVIYDSLPTSTSVVISVFIHHSVDELKSPANSLRPGCNADSLCDTVRRLWKHDHIMHIAQCSLDTPVQFGHQCSRLRSTTCVCLKRCIFCKTDFSNFILFCRYWLIYWTWCFTAMRRRGWSHCWLILCTM